MCKSTLAKESIGLPKRFPISVTRLGDLLQQLFWQITHILGNFVKVSKSFIFGQLLKTFGDFLLVTLFPNESDEVVGGGSL